MGNRNRIRRAQWLAVVFLVGIFGALGNASQAEGEMALSGGNTGVTVSGEVREENTDLLAAGEGEIVSRNDKSSEKQDAEHSDEVGKKADETAQRGGTKAERSGEKAKGHETAAKGRNQGTAKETKDSEKRRSQKRTDRKKSNIDALIASYQQASKEKAYQVMNRIKSRIATMNLEEQKAAIGQLQSAVAEKSDDVYTELKAHQKEVENTMKEMQQHTPAPSQKVRGSQTEKHGAKKGRQHHNRNRSKSAKHSRKSSHSRHAHNKGRMDPMSALNGNFDPSASMNVSPSGLGSFGGMGGFGGMGDFGGGMGGF